MFINVNLWIDRSHPRELWRQICHVLWHLNAEKRSFGGMQLEISEWEPSMTQQTDYKIYLTIVKIWGAYTYNETNKYVDRHENVTPLQ